MVTAALTIGRACTTLARYQNRVKAITTALTSSDTHLADNYEWRDLALLFTVANQSRDFFVGSAWVPPVIEIQCDR